MCRARATIATTSLDALMERQNGFAGRGIVVGSLDGSERWWIWRVQSQDAETNIASQRESSP